MVALPYFIYIGSHRFGPEIARQIRKSDVEMEKAQGDIEALDSVRFFFTCVTSLILLLFAVSPPL